MHVASCFRCYSLGYCRMMRKVNLPPSSTAFWSISSSICLDLQIFPWIPKFRSSLLLLFQTQLMNTIGQGQFIEYLLLLCFTRINTRQTYIHIEYDHTRLVLFVFHITQFYGTHILFSGQNYTMQIVNPAVVHKMFFVVISLISNGTNTSTDRQSIGLVGWCPSLWSAVHK